MVVFAKRHKCLNRSFEYAFFNNREKGQYNLNVIHGNSASLENNSSGNHAVFPEYFVRWFIEKFTKEGDVVFDCFMGSGTVASVAQQMNRNYLGCELDESYIKYAEERLSQKSLVSEWKW